MPLAALALACFVGCSTDSQVAATLCSAARKASIGARSRSASQARLGCSMPRTRVIDPQCSTRRPSFDSIRASPLTSISGLLEDRHVLTGLRVLTSVVASSVAFECPGRARSERIHSRPWGRGVRCSRRQAEDPDRHRPGLPLDYHVIGCPSLISSSLLLSRSSRRTRHVSRFARRADLDHLRGHSGTLAPTLFSFVLAAGWLGRGAPVRSSRRTPRERLALPPRPRRRAWSSGCALLGTARPGRL